MILTLLREADWLNRRRVLFYGWAFASVNFVIGLAWIVLSTRGLDPLGKPLGTDFASFWAASRLALDGNPAGAYYPRLHYQTQLETFGVTKLKYSAFFYPPTYLLICYPLALLPYLPALVVWLGTTGYAYARVARAYLGAKLILPIFAFPAVFINIGHGQNGFLITALFGGALLNMSRRPVIAGSLFGCLMVKPHLALIVPIVVLALGQWRMGIAGVITAATFSALSLVLFGPDAWRNFFDVAPLARSSLEQNWIGNEKMQSVFAAVRLLGGSVEIGYILHVAAAAVACVALVVLLRRFPESPSAGPAIACAALLTSPFVLDYDLTLLAIPLAWIAREGVRTGFLTWEKLALLLGFVLPFVCRFIASLGVPIAPLVLAAVFAAIIRRAYEVRAEPRLNLLPS